MCKRAVHIRKRALHIRKALHIKYKRQYKKKMQIQNESREKGRPIVRSSMEKSKDNSSIQHGVAIISRLLKNIGLFCRLYSLL